ncbi:hypothetical protein HO133_002092 [Letharia lupina]|uniref:Methyltransferase domain-containing protein n=1 Tax=Letharia lupina TaxID=560253 RepID=A0A8H6CCZ9_9LECA|nr:uncharacterized protein HO133_002092 [Letharia lupina]KAF6221237.1 hypothetical protein HO133_002092 [Letharia lupina]
MASSSDSSLFDGGADFDWIKYTTHRPAYSSSFYDRIWTYHQSHSNHWSLAHDVGTGPGNVAEVLGARFDKVIASDPSGFHTAVARRRLAASNVTVEQCRAEDLVTLVGPDGHGKADLVTLAECIPLMDAERAFSGFAELLRPGGTLAVWFYGKPIFVGEGQERSQQIYDRIAGKAFSRIFPIKGTIWQQAFTVMASWLDNIGFPSEDWTDVERTKWNHDKPLCFLPEEYFDFEVKHENSVTADEKVEERVDRDFWAKEHCGVDWVEGFIDAQFPWKSTDDEIGAQLKPMYKELEEAMGGQGSKTKIAWPVALVLATRK